MPSPIEIMAARAASRSASGLEGFEVPQFDESTSATDILRNVGSMGLGVVSSVGNALDLPGSIARDLLAGKGFLSFDQLATPFTDENRTTGRELLNVWGLAPREKETGLTPFADPEEFMYDAMGFLAEVYTDPFGPIGKLLKVPRAASKLLAKGAGLAEAGVRAVPYGNHLMDAAIKNADIAKRFAKRVFYAPSGGTFDARAQAIAEPYHEAVRTGTDRVMALASLAVRHMDDTGFKMTVDSPDYFENMKAFRRYVEGTEEFAKNLNPNIKLFPDELKPMIDGLRQQEALLRVNLARFYNTADLVDQAGINHWSRRMSDRFKAVLIDELGHTASPATRRLGGLPDGASNLREQMLKGFYGGTVDLDEILKNPRWTETANDIKLHPELKNLSDGLHQEFLGVAGPRHIMDIAEKMNTTPKQLWQDIGFSAEKPWEPIDNVEAALNRFMDVQRGLARKGQGALRPRKAFGSLFMDILGGERTRVRFGKDGAPVLPGGQVWDSFDDLEPNEIFGWLREQTRDPAALERITMAEEAGLKPVSWVVDGERKIFIPEQTAQLDYQWNKQLERVRRGAERSPLREIEVVRDVYSHMLERDFSDRIIKDMPHINSDGMFVYEQYNLDDLGNMYPTGQTIKRKMSEATAFEQMNEAEIATGFIRQKMDNRYDALADMLASHVKVREMSLFDNDPMIDYADSMISMIKRIEVGKAVAKTIAESAVENESKLWKQSRVALGRGEAPEGQTVLEFLKQNNHFDRDGLISEIADEVRKIAPALLGNKENLDGLKFSQEFKDYILNTALDPKLKGELDQMFQHFEPLPEANSIRQAMDTYLTIFKASNLSNPSSVVRDAFSAGINSFAMGDMNFDLTSVASIKDMRAILKGTLPGKIDHKDVLAYLNQLNLPDTDANRAKAFASMFAGAMHQQRMHYFGGDSASVDASGLAQTLIDGIPGGQPRGLFESLFNRMKSQSLGQNLNPINVPGVPITKDGITKPRSSANLIVGTAGDIREYMDHWIRGASVLNRMRNGESFRQAFDTVAAHQINYDPRTFSRFERTWLKRLFPFYSFISRSIPMVATELATNPGGRLGQIIRLERFAQGGEDSYVPYDLQDSTAINLGSNPAGEVKYITNIGLMHEDALTYIAPTQGVRGMLTKVIGSSNPLVKGIIEGATNTSTFFDGPMGGRRLDDLDPALGRILNNFKRFTHKHGLTGPADDRPEPFIHPIVEQIAANSPASAAMRYARIISEPSERRGTLEKILNLTTGARTKIVTPQAMTRELQDRLNQTQIEMGAHPITIATGVQKLALKMAESGDIEGAQRLINIQKSLAFLRKKLEMQNEKVNK